MNKMKLALLATSAMVSLAGTLVAADTSVTEVVRRANTTAGTKHSNGLVKATVTSAAASAGALTVDAPTSSQSIAGWTANVRDTSGRLAFPAIVLVGSTFYVSNSNSVSGTLATSQTVTIDITYDRNQ